MNAPACIANDDSLFRHSVYPVAFKKGAHDWDRDSRAISRTRRMGS